jgi:hypothetical protein
MNSSGDRHARKQACFSGVNSYTPAAINTAPAIRAFVVAMAGESHARRSSNHCRSVAARLNPHHTATYAAAKMAMAAYGEPPRRRRSMVAKRSTMGAALGSIMATIMTAHIASISAK